MTGPGQNANSHLEYRCWRIKKMKIFQLVTVHFLALATVIFPLQADTLKLPSRLKENATTAAAGLGIQDKGLGLKVGDQVPPFTTLTAEGQSVTLDELLGSGKLMFFFYRGGWCPYCNYQVRMLSLAYQEFASKGVTPIAVSVDSSEAALLVKSGYEVPFTVISDSKLAAQKAFKVLIKVDDATYDRYRGKGVDLERWSGQDHHMIAAPAVVLVDEDRTVRWSHVSRDYKTRPSVKQLLDVIDSQL